MSTHGLCILSQLCDLRKLISSVEIYKIRKEVYQCLNCKRLADIQDVVTYSSFSNIMVKVESLIFIPVCFGLINRKDFFENYHLHPHEPGICSVDLRIFQFSLLILYQFSTTLILID